MRHGRGAGWFALPSVRWSPQLVTIHSLKLTPTKPTLPKSTDAFSESVIAFGCDPCLVSCQISPINQFLHVNQLLSEWVSPWVFKLVLSLHIPLMLPLLVGVLDETDSCEVLSEWTADWFGLSYRNFACTALLASDFSLKKILVS